MMQFAEYPNRDSAEMNARTLRLRGFDHARAVQFVTIKFVVTPDSDPWDASYMGEQVSAWGVTTTAPRTNTGIRTRYIFRK